MTKLKKEGLGDKLREVASTEDKLREAASTILDQFNNYYTLENIPEEIILDPEGVENKQDLSLFKEILEEELALKDYNATVIVGNKKGYVVGVSYYLKRKTF